MRSYRTEGVVIKRRNFGEADRLLTLFTKKAGKIQIKAPGVRRITSRRSPHIELLNHSFITLYQGRNLPVLIEAQTIEDFSGIKEDLIRVGFSYHICELVDGLCPDNQENKTIYFFLIDVLSRLSTEEDIVPIIHDFEINLLIKLGFYPPGRLSQNFNTHSFIENILEKKLRSKQVLSRLL